MKISEVMKIVDTLEKDTVNIFTKVFPSEKWEIYKFSYNGHYINLLTDLTKKAVAYDSILQSYFDIYETYCIFNDLIFIGIEKHEKEQLEIIYQKKLKQISYMKSILKGSNNDSTKK